mgnify:FL=1|jgi:hypothetical protein
MTKRQIELILESIVYHQLHLQKLYEQQTNEDLKQLVECQHYELCEISKMLIKELDNYENDNF